MKTSAVVRALLVLAVCVALLPTAVAAVTIAVQASGGDPGSSVEVRISMTGGHDLAAGMQTDISWDPHCLSVVSGTDNAAACYSNPAIPKSVSTKIRNGSILRAVFLSISDVDPIKQDTWLFTCQFNINATTTAAQCPVNLMNVIVSDPKGGRLPLSVVNGVVQIHQSPVPAASAAPSVAAGVSGSTSAGKVDSEGCAIAASRPGSWALLWLLIIPTLGHRRRRPSRS